MSKIKVYTGAFQSKEEAVREIGAQGLWPYSLDAAAGDTYPAHHHKTGEVFYLISGSLVFTEEDDGQEHPVQPGDKMLIPAGQGHSVRAVADSIYLMGLKEFIPIEVFPIWHEPEDRRQFFDTLNRKFGDAEKSPVEGEAFFREVLSERLQFRRAGGGDPIGKADFLKGLRSPDNETDEIRSWGVEVLEYSRDVTLVSLLVHLKGKRGGKAIDATFRNTRVFLREQGMPRCVLWFNTPAEPGAAADSGRDVGSS